MPLRPGTRCLSCNSHHQGSSESQQCKHCIRNPNGQLVPRPITPVPHSASDFPRPSGSSGGPSFPTGPGLTLSASTTTLDEFSDISTALHGGGLFDNLQCSDYSFSPNDLSSDGHLDFPLPTDDTWHASLTLPVVSVSRSPPESLSETRAVLADQLPMNNYSVQPVDALAMHPKRTVGRQSLGLSSHSSSAGAPYSSRSRSNHRTPNKPVGHLTSGQASLFQALFSLARPEDSNPVPNPTNSPPSNYESPDHFPYSNTPSQDEDEDEDENDNDGKAVEEIFCVAPRMDSNVQSNTLAFVLSSYARWFTLTMFNPLRVVHPAKHNIMRQFSNSDDDRMRVILVANAFAAIGRTTELNSRGVSIVSVLRTGLHEGLAQFNSRKPSPIRELDMQYASVALENILEVILIHFYCSSLPVILRLMQRAAPIFRRACSEPLDQLPNLPNILLAPELHKRYFAAIDVGLSVLAARPMFFRYDVTYPPGFLDQETPPHFGVEWMHGIPDRLVVLFARINALREDFGTSVDPQMVAEIEAQIEGAKMDIMSDDPSLKLRRLVVQECWRQSTFIYLYMALCGTNAQDPRVRQAVRKFMNLEKSISPSRHPDAFMFISMIVAGAAACKQSDRDKIRRRMLGTRECSITGIVGNDHVRVLIDLWTRMDKEGRVATWEDFRKSNERVIGV